MEVFQMLIAIEGRERSNSKASGRGDTSQKVSERALRRTSILAMTRDESTPAKWLQTQWLLHPLLN